VMKRIVLDTCVIVSGFRSRNGASNSLLNAVANGVILPLLSIALFLEYQAVLLRDEQMAAHGLSAEDVLDALLEFADMSEPVEAYFKWRPQLGDPKDEMVLEAAIAGQADALVTHNVRDFAIASRLFGVNVIRPGEFLKGIMQ
jgi:putative PIN family toxin of toxin-antitoxin system